MILLETVVPAAGLEPARPSGLEILSLLCLPFHHAGNVRHNSAGERHGNPVPRCGN